MKKHFILATAIILLIALLPISFVYAVNDIDDTKENISDNLINFSMEVNDRFLPFIYCSDDSWLTEYLDVYPGSTECVDGYFYVLDRKENTIRLLTTEKVRVFRETPNAVFCVMVDGRICQLDYFGKMFKVIYVSKVDTITLCERMNDNLYFVEGDHVVCLDLRSYETQIVLKAENITGILPIENNILLWWNDSEQYWLVDLNEKNAISCALTEAEFNNKISVAIDPTLAALQGSSLYVVDITTQETLPLSNYPSGSSYFTKNGQACTDHDVLYNNPYHISSSCNCKKYGGAYQCMGFAYYASDRYAHILGTDSQRPSIASGDRISDITFGYDASVAAYFDNLTKGAYIRFSKTSTSGEGNHSVVYIAHNSQGVYVYDCNWDHQCGVQYRFMSYYSLRTKYPHICNGFSHNWEVTEITSTLHKLECTSAGCYAQVIENHEYFNMDSNGVCDMCGYEY